MQGVSFELDGRKLADVDQFHSEFAEALGFPDFYGRNMDAWIDCMSYLDDPEGNIALSSVEPGSTVAIKISNHSHFKERAPQLWAALEDCTETVNGRFCDAGTNTKIVLLFGDK